MTFRPGIKISFERGIGAATSDATIPYEEARHLLATLAFMNREGFRPLAEALEWALEAEAEPTGSAMPRPEERAKMAAEALYGFDAALADVYGQGYLAGWLDAVAILTEEHPEGAALGNGTEANGVA